MGMNDKEELNIFQETALKFGITEEEVRCQMQAALDASWDSAESVSVILRTQIFPNGKPSLEEFIVTLACISERKLNHQ